MKKIEIIIFLINFQKVVKIQKKWKSLKIRKMMFKATIRNIWNKNMTQFFFLIKKEKMMEKQGMTTSIDIELTANHTSPVNSSPANSNQKYFFFFF